MGNTFTTTIRDEIATAHRLIEFCRQVEEGHKSVAPTRLEVAEAVDYLRKFAPTRANLVAATFEEIVAPTGTARDANARSCRELIESLLKSMDADSKAEAVLARMPPPARPIPRSKAAGEQPQSKAKQPAGDDGKWSQPDSPKRWGKVFGFSSRTFVRHAEKKKIRTKKLSDKSYQVHVDDLPSGRK